MNLLIQVLILILVLTKISWADNNTFSPEQIQFLNDVRIETFKTLEKGQREAYLLRQCFMDDRLCEKDLLTKKTKIRAGIIQRNEEYRLLVGLSVSSQNLQKIPYASLGFGFPRVYFNNNNLSEVRDIRDIEARDIHWIEYKLSAEDQNQRRPTDPEMQPFRVQFEINQSRQFYKHQAYLLVSQLPFIPFIKTATPSDRDIALALSEYLTRLDTVLLELYDLQKTPLESFVIYTPIVQKLIRENPAREQIFLNIKFKQKALYGLKAWLEKNTPSLTMAGFATCSFVSAVLQAWPVALSCGGIATAFTGRQLYLDYHNLHQDFTLWMAGVQSQSTYTDRQARILYTSLTLLFIGQGVTSTLAGIEASLATVLSQLPSTAATRFTSLTALRESSVDFAKSFVEFRSKDLTGSLIAETHAKNQNTKISLTRSERLFSYADFILLEDGITQIK
ncbi:MAG: hypothetical protein ACLGGX_12425 [Bdellovibrionia bacterium]